MTDAYESTTNLGKALGLIEAQTQGVATAFGDAAESSKVWNIASRLLSGSGLWKLQNKIRAIGNVVFLYNKNLSGQEEAQRRALDAQAEMGRTLQSLSTDLQNAQNFSGGLYEQFLAFENLKNPMGGVLNEINAQEKAVKKLESAQEGLNKVMQKQADLERYGKVGTFLRNKGLGKDVNIFSRKFLMDTAASAVGGTKDVLGGLQKKVFGVLALVKPSNLIGAFKNIGTGKFSQLTALSLLAFSSLLGFAAIGTILFGVLYRSWPTIQKALETAAPQFRAALDNVINILKGLFVFFKALFEGKFKKALVDGLIPILTNFLGLLKNILFGLGKIIVNLIIAGAKALYNRTFGRLRFLPKFARGGVSSGGMALVGENGPELVTLPSGARVHSNQASRGMGGNVINVHVNGRVGASDAEIKDIANKVAREINLRMNRTGASAGRF